MKNKIIALSLATIFVLNPISTTADTVGSTDMGLFGDSMINVTPAQSWEDARSGIQYSSGGSIVFKFKRESSYPAMVELKSPKGGATCSGFSFNMGFLGLLNTDGIEEQLKNASQAFMWGILTAFKLSTPQLSAVFEWINDQIRQMQDLLRNACNYGKMLATNVAGKDNLNVLEKFDNIFEGLTPKESSDVQQKSWSEKTEKVIQDLGNKSPEETAQNLGDMTFVAVFKELEDKGVFVNTLSSRITKVVDHINTLPSTQPFYMKKNKLSDILSGKFKYTDNEEITWSSISEEQQSIKAQIILSMKFFGDTAISSNADTVFNELESAAKMASEDFKTWAESYLKDRVQTTSAFSQQIEISETLEHEQNTQTADAIVDLLYHGPSDGSKQLSIKDRNVWFMAVPKRKDSASATATILKAKAGFILDSTPLATDIKMSFNGLSNSSTDNVLYVLEKYAGGALTTTDQKTYTFNTTGTKRTTPKDDIPYVAKSLQQSVKIVGMYIRYKNMVDNKTTEIINQLVDENVYYLSLTLIDLASDAWIVNRKNANIKLDPNELQTHLAKVTEAKSKLYEKCGVAKFKDFQMKLNSMAQEIENFSPYRNR